MGFKKLQECRQWMADATYIDEHSDLARYNELMVDSWFDKNCTLQYAGICKGE